MAELFKLWEEKVKDEDKESDIRKYSLGLVGKHYQLNKTKQEKEKEEKGERNKKVEADHIPPTCVFRNLYTNPFYTLAKWHHDHKHDGLKNSLDKSLGMTIEKIISGKHLIEEEYKIFKEIIDTMTREYAKENKDKSEQEDSIKKRIAIKLCIKKNEYEKMILERMELETDLNIKTKLEKLEKSISDNEEKPNFYKLICKNGDRGACRKVLKIHHEQGLTHGNYKYSQAISAILQRALLSGHGEKLIKWSLMVENPTVSKYIQVELKKKFPKLKMNNNREEEEQMSDVTMKYHHIGDELLVEYYSEFITEQEKNNLTQWLTQTNPMDTAYCGEILIELIAEIEHQNTKGKKSQAAQKHPFALTFVMSEQTLVTVNI